MRTDRISEIRQEYQLGELLEGNLLSTPFEQFGQWFEEALRYQVMEPNAMVLCTVSEEGAPSSRVVLLKDFDPDGFVFYTNYQSRKGRELLGDPRASLLFFWPELQRQVRIEGTVKQVATSQSEAYFHSRPKGSQLGAWVSPQSQEIPGRQFLDNKLTEIAERFADREQVERPPHWGGFVLSPARVEFWQGREDRLHDRLVFDRLQNQVSWTVKRLAP